MERLLKQQIKQDPTKYCELHPGYRKKRTEVVLARFHIGNALIRHVHFLKNGKKYIFIPYQEFVKSKTSIAMTSKSE